MRYLFHACCRFIRQTRDMIIKSSIECMHSSHVHVQEKIYGYQLAAVDTDSKRTSSGTQPAAHRLLRQESGRNERYAHVLNGSLCKSCKRNG
jgi:hypothetical protein